MTLEQFGAFAEITTDCSRCGGPTALADLQPTARGMTCRVCMTAMPGDEFEELRAEGDALANTEGRSEAQDG